MTEEKKIDWKKEFYYWLTLGGIILILYVTGWHTEVRGRLQQALLWTNLIQPDTEMAPEDHRVADYNLRLVSLDGETVSLSEYKGKVVFINFWASWCPPCIAEMPGIQKLYEEYAERQDMIFLMINVDEQPEKAQTFLDNREFTFGSYRLAGPRPPAFQSTILPTTYVIDREGTVVLEERGMANYDSAKFRMFLNSLLDS